MWIVKSNEKRRLRKSSQSKCGRILNNWSILKQLNIRLILKDFKLGLNDASSTFWGSAKGRSSDLGKTKSECFQFEKLLSQTIDSRKIGNLTKGITNCDLQFRQWISSESLTTKKNSPRKSRSPLKCLAGHFSGGHQMTPGDGGKWTQCSGKCAMLSNQGVNANKTRPAVIWDLS